MDAKQTLINFIPLIDSKLKMYWDQEINLNFGFNQKQKDLVRKILFHSCEHNLRPAKRLRASFVYYAYLLGNKINSKIWNIAMAAELIHTALLMHDDFMDQDEIRRGLPTTHKFFENGNPHYGESMAVDIGDAVLLMGYELLIRSGFSRDLVIKVTSQFLRGVVNTAFGQAFDVTVGQDPDWTENDVFTIHRSKTAIYTYENPLFAGAILAKLPQKVFKILHQYSLDGGLAFQIQDDILGVFGNPKKTGKSADSDLLQRKCTLLISHLLKFGSVSQVDALKKVWGKKSAPESDIALAKAAIVDSGSLEYSKNIAKDYALKAVNTAQELRNLKLNNEAIDFIEGVADYIVNRDL